MPKVRNSKGRKKKENLRVLMGKGLYRREGRVPCRRCDEQTDIRDKSMIGRSVCCWRGEGIRFARARDGHRGRRIEPESVATRGRREATSGTTALTQFDSLPGRA